MPFLENLRALQLPPADLPPMVAVFVVAWSFFVASCIGSFLNVVIARLPKGVSVVTPRSRCPKCGKQIEARDNVPIASWLALGGKCRACKAPISPRYPAVEALVGLLGAALVTRYGLSLPALELFVFSVLLIAIAFIDLDTWTVPNPLSFGLIGTGLAFGAVGAWLDHDASALIGRAIGGAGAFVMLAAVLVASTGILRRLGRITAEQDAMGWGDPLIIAGIGAYLGWRMLILVVFLAAAQGSIVGLVLRRMGKLDWTEPVSEDDPWIPPKGALPFGPFLALAGLEAAFFGSAILERVLPIWSVA